MHTPMCVARDLGVEELPEYEVWVQDSLAAPLVGIPDHFDAATVGPWPLILLREEISSSGYTLAHELAHLSLARHGASDLPWSLEEAVCQHVAHR